MASKDGRSADAVLLRRTRAALTKHIGDRPSATQRALIERAAMLTLHLARMDTQAMEAGGMSDHASRQYLAWSNTLTRTMVRLGLEATPPPQQRWQPFEAPGSTRAERQAAALAKATETAL